MRSRVRRRAVLVGLGPLIGFACAAHAADPKPAYPDSEFLEYLGSSDDTDSELLEFLGSSDDVDSELQQYLAKRDASETQDAKPAPKRGSGKT